MTEMRNEFIVFNCPKCNHQIDVARCSNCAEYERNMTDYESAKECWNCDMFHKNFRPRLDE